MATDFNNAMAWESAAQTIRDTLDEVRRTRDPHCLESATVGIAVACMLSADTAEIAKRDGLASEWIAALGEVAWLCWCRYHSGLAPDPARYLVIAVDMFRRVGAVLPNVPADVTLFIAGCAGEIDAFDDDPFAMGETARLLSDYGIWHQDVAILKAARDLLNLAVDRFGKHQPEQRKVLANLGNLAVELSRIEDDPMMAVEAVAYGRRAVTGIAVDDPAYADLMAALGAALFGAAARTADAELAAEAVDVLGEVVRVHPVDHWHAGFVGSLARAQGMLWTFTHDVEHLDVSIRTHRSAIDETDSADPWLSSRRLHLMMSLLARAEVDAGEHISQSARSELGQQIEEMSRHLQPRRPDDATFAAEVIRIGWWTCGGDGLLDEAIRWCQLAADSGGSRAEVGTLLFERWTRQHDEVDLAACIEHLSAAVRAPADGRPVAREVNALARALRATWETTSDSVALREATGLLQQLIDIEPTSSPDLAMYENNLGSMLLRQWEANGEETINAALDHLRTAGNIATDNEHFSVAS